MQEAEALWRRVLHTRRAQFGDMDARTAASMYNLATALREVLPDDALSLGAFSPEVSNMSATVIEQVKQSDEALRLFKEELEVCTSLSGP